MNKKRSQLLRDLIAPNPDIESIFFRLKVILNDLPDIDGTVQIRKWIDNELSGYPNSTLLPEYRIMKGTPQGTYITNYTHQFSNATVPIRLSNMPLKDIEHWEIINITNPIKDIQNMIKQDKPVGRSIPTELLHLYSTDEFQMLGVTMQLAPSQLFTIETTVKRKLTEIILELEKEFVDIDELDISEEISMNPQKTEQVIQNLFTTITDQSINIGDNNEIKKSRLGFFKK